MIRDEFEWIKSITPSASYQEDLLIGIGDDAALWSVDSKMDQVVCVDTMVEGVHFTRKTLSPLQIGYKALAVNMSDIAAMGAIPMFYLVSIAIPKEWDENALQEIYKGMSELAKSLKTDLIGGDTVSTEGPLVLTVTVIGKVEEGRHLLRSRAKPDDVVFLTGEIGESAAGLKLLLDKTHHYPFTDQEAVLKNKHQMPVPHIEQGRLLAKSGFRIALNDVSDGIASELNEIAEASNVTIHIDENRLPASTSLEGYPRSEQVSLQLFGGEDYVLTGTMARENYRQMVSLFHQNDLPLYEIGRVGEAGKAAVYLHRSHEPERERLTKKGFNHFRER
jgi:thiamine-monophosphate kinase